MSPGGRQTGFPRRATWALIAAIGWTTLAGAHEIGTTRVTAQVGVTRYVIEVVTDAVSLVEKLESLGDPAATVPPAAGAPAAVLEKRLLALDGVFRQRVGIAFDGSAVVPATTYAVADPSDEGAPPIATIRLTGEVPHDARLFTWVYSWTFTPYALTVGRGASGEPATEWLEGGEASTPFPVAATSAPTGRAGTAWRYLALGFTHIVPHGLDHVLFVLGIFLLSRRLSTVLAQVTAFTVAHSITLGLSINGLIAVPPTFVEPLIAVSIAYVAIENLVVTGLKPWRIALVFGFGLLHGMGFAGALMDLGLPRAEFLTALLTFNAGVEAGQLTVIAAAFLLVGWGFGDRDWYRRRVVVPASVLIACTGVYWTIERVAWSV